MVYQLKEYLKLQFPNESFYVNVASANNNQLPDRIITLFEPPGREQPHFQLNTKPIQFSIRDIDPVKSYKLANQIFDYLANCYDFDLPAVTISGTNYPIVNIGAANPGNTPSPFGPDTESRITFLFTIIFTFRRA